MRIGVLGTGMVGRAFAAKLVELDHDVLVGTRDPAATLAREEPEPGYGIPPFRVWHEQHPGVKLGTFADAAAHGELVVNATAGAASLEVLRLAGEANLAGKVLVDIANALDHSQGMPPSLLAANTDSLGERIQRAFPATRVVKALNTMNAQLMVNPRQRADGDHTVFVCDDPQAKAVVTGLLTEGFGWRDVVDLGDITTARGPEMLLALWLRLWGALGTPMFNIKVVR
ncbi:MAG TPA: NAD(P)-binding domain-containing protein [Actinomycetes bacterium]|jgi:8-hydroxy-5-deazaflavin:NADPH oxidoreductase